MKQVFMVKALFGEEHSGDELKLLGVYDTAEKAKERIDEYMLDEEFDGDDYAIWSDRTEGDTPNYERHLTFSHNCPDEWATIYMEVYDVE